MKVGMIGIGEMGVLMAGHIVAAGHIVYASDVVPERVSDAVKRGARGSDLSELSKSAEMFIIMVRTDDQVRGIVDTLAHEASAGSLVAVSGTHHPNTMKELASQCAEKRIGFVDCPVVYGMDGARDGKLLSLCGGTEEDVARAAPVLRAYSRDVLRVGPTGAGQIAKTCNNLLHWIHAVANFEALLLAKRYGIDAQRMREVLLQAPAANGTLARWSETKFTWQEKDMDVVMELAQSGGLVLPLSGQVDQLVKLFRADDVSALMSGPEAAYLGKKFAPLSPSEGGLGPSS